MYPTTTRNTLGPPSSTYNTVNHQRLSSIRDRDHIYESAIIIPATTSAGVTASDDDALSERHYFDLDPNVAHTTVDGLQ